MSVYTVHEPPLRLADDAPDAERIAFVRDGFSFWAFLFVPLWMLRHGLWLVLVIYLVVVAGLETAVKIAGASGFSVGLIGFLISLLIGLEASTLRRFTLGRRGWKNIGVVSGEDREDAERRFFEGWAQKAVAQPRTPTVTVPATPATMNPRMPHAPDVIGLFPEPGANR
jgi:hypothetical protein